MKALRLLILSDLFKRLKRLFHLCGGAFCLSQFLNKKNGLKGRNTSALGAAKGLCPEGAELPCLQSCLALSGLIK